VIAAGCLLLGACHGRSEPGDAASAATQSPAASGARAPRAGNTAPNAAEASAQGVTLSPDQIDKLGLVTQPAQAVEYEEEAAGYGVVQSHGDIAQGAAELISAQATERQSRAALVRAQKLAGTPGAVSAEVEQAAVQKAAVDAAALTLTNERLSATLGMNPPWKSVRGSSTLRELASGRIKLLRATFPLGAFHGGAPTSLRAARIGATAPATGWKLHTIWDAPADASMPGRSFFALLEGSDMGEGERLRVWAPTAKPVTGVLIPSAAAVMSDGRYWCYIERRPGTFVRVEIDTARLMADGYFVTEGVTVGDKVAATAVGQLLATEVGAAAGAD
jgi:hypothetical protein